MTADNKRIEETVNQVEKPGPDGGNERPVYLDTNLRIIFSVTLIAVLGVASLTPAFPLITRELHIPARQIGLLITAFTLPGVILTPILGVLADRFGRKRVLVPSLFLFGLAGSACALAGNLHLLLALRFLQGIGAASLGSINVTIIGDIYRGRDRAAAMGYNASVLNLGMAGYPAIGGALAMLGWHYPFLLPLLAVPVGLAVIFSLRNPEPKGKEVLNEYLAKAWQSLLDRRVLALFVAGLATFLILYGSYLSYFPLLVGHTFGRSPLVIGLIMSGTSLSTAFTSSRLGRLTAMFSEKTLVGTAFILYAVSLSAFPFVRHLWALFPPILLFGIAQGLNIPSIQSLLASLAPMEYRAAFMSINGMILRLGQTLGPVATGVVFGIWGINAAFFFGAVLALAAFGCLAVLLR